MTKQTKSNLITYGGIIIAYILIQIALSTGHVSSLMEGLLVPVCTYVILAVSLNLTVGILGELSLGHAGFMCIGAFSSAFFSKCMQSVIPVATLRFFLALLVGAAVAAVFGFLIGIPVLRLKGDYLAIVTLAFGEIIKNFMNAIYVGKDQSGFHFSMKDTIALGLDESGEVIIKGAQGITGTPHDSNFTIAVVLILIAVFIITNFVQS
ncbi:MAG: branched-chain amino acid ABC transporter permease, partial [Lachnospiraceae bacterium]|nr:branched-chain amino acid ABC transporter permease [Lachnospiraceae bacterium]